MRDEAIRDVALSRAWDTTGSLSASVTHVLG
jgi:hypothetical protein